MSLFNPHRLLNPYADAFAAPPLPDAIKIETGPAAAYEYERRGIRAENAQIVAINRGELETSTSRGDFLRFSVPVVTASETYYVDQVVTETGNGGDTAFVPLIEGPEAPDAGAFDLIYEPYATEQTPYIPYEDLSAYNYGQGEYVETAVVYFSFDEQSPYYVPPDNGVSYVAPEPTPVDPPQLTQEQYDAEAAQQAIYEQAYQDYLQYIAGQQTEDYIDYYGGGEIV